MTFKCFLPAWIAAWVASVFVPSAMIAYLGISEAASAIGTGLHRLPASTWKVADDVGPVVKLMIGGLLLVCPILLGRMQGLSRQVRYATSMAIGVVTLVITIGLVPETLSRGFAIALTGGRLDPSTTPIYLLGGALAGLVFAVSYERCSRKRSE